MKNNLEKLLENKSKEVFSTTAGASMHKKLERVFFYPNSSTGDLELCKKISKNTELVKIMGKLSKTEVPVAGVVHGRFISRRIDRLYISDADKQVIVLDYKTDINKETFREKYITQLREYRDLLKQIYPEYNISCKILWTCDFVLENII